jgi:hypothetical protein
VDTDIDAVTLWRPTGPEELALVEASGWREWPPRLPGQPIFYPVLNEDYATKIARVRGFRSADSGGPEYQYGSVSSCTGRSYWPSTISYTSCTRQPRRRAGTIDPLEWFVFLLGGSDVGQLFGPACPAG